MRKIRIDLITTLVWAYRQALYRCGTQEEQEEVREALEELEKGEENDKKRTQRI